MADNLYEEVIAMRISANYYNSGQKGFNESYVPVKSTTQMAEEIRIKKSGFRNPSMASQIDLII